MNTVTLKQLMKRRSSIIAQLSTLSRNGWAGAKPCDYEPLEAELKDIEKKLGLNR